MARELVNVYAGLGANLGHASQSIDSAILALGQLPETLLVGRSSFYKSAPFQADGPDYINAVVHLQTRLNAIELLRAFQNVENLAGRERPYRNAPRTLDIDLLLYGDGNIQWNYCVLFRAKKISQAASAPTAMRPARWT